MLFEQSRLIKLNPHAEFLHGFIVFEDHSVVIIQLNIMQRSTTIRYFSKQNSETQKQIASYPRIFYEYGSLVDKQLFLVDINQGQIIVLDFYKNQLSKTVYQQEELKYPRFSFDLYTFSDTSTFAVCIHGKQNNTRKVLYYHYPNKFIYEQTIEVEKRKFIKLNERGEMGLFNPQFNTIFKLSCVSFEQKTFSQFLVPIQNASYVRSVYRLTKDKFVFLLSNNLNISIYDVFTREYKNLVNITSPQFAFKNKQNGQINDTQQNVIFNWIPLKDYIAVSIINSKEKGSNCIYQVDYKGKIIGSHKIKIGQNNWLKSSKGRQYIESNYHFQRTTEISIKEWEVTHYKDVICFLADQGLELNEQMVSAIVNSVDYDS